MSKLVDLDDLMTSAEAAALLSVKNTTLEIWRSKGKGPEFLKFGDTPQSPVRYRRSVVLAWRDKRAFKSTSAYTAAAKLQNPSPSDATA